MEDVNRVNTVLQFYSYYSLSMQDVTQKRLAIVVMMVMTALKIS